jgi:hypothetical protein
MNLGIARRFTIVGVLIAAAGSLAMVTVTGAAGASHLPRAASRPAHGTSASHRQIGTAELTYFKVVLTATRAAGQPPTATVTAAGYERSGTGWRLLAVKRLGKVGQWFWNSVQTCSLNITEFKGISPVQVFDSAKISLLATPALGCIRSFSEQWQP